MDLLTAAGSGWSKQHASIIAMLSCLQIVHEAERIFGVAHTNRISRVWTIELQDALTFLQASLVMFIYLFCPL